MPVSKCYKCNEPTRQIFPAEIRPGCFVSNVNTYKCRNNHCDHWHEGRLLPGEEPLYPLKEEEKVSDTEKETDKSCAEIPQKSPKKNSKGKTTQKKKSTSKKAEKE